MKWQYIVFGLEGDRQAQTEQLNTMGQDGWIHYETVGRYGYARRPRDSETIRVAPPAASAAPPAVPEPQAPATPPKRTGRNK